MATAETIVDAFDDLGFTLEDSRVIDRLASLCDMYQVDENKISCEYLAYLNQKKYPMSEAPTIEMLEAFENEALKVISASGKKSDKTFGQIVYNSSTLPKHFHSEGTEYDPDDDEGELSGYYGESKATPVRSKQVKRQVSPDNDSLTSRKRFIGAELDSPSPMPFSPNSLTYNKGPSNDSSTPTSGGKRYSARTNSGQVLIRFGNGGNPLPLSTWTTPEKTFSPEVHILSPLIDRKEYRYMFERLREKAGYLDEIICKIGDVLIDRNHSIEPQSISQVAPEPYHVVGRICCDSDGKLNPKSIVLQGSQDTCLGRAVPLDAAKITEYSLFPGQVIAAEVTNPNGSKLIATEFHSDASAQKPPNNIRLSTNGTMQAVVACGPYTTGDNLQYEPLKDLLKYVVEHKPHLIILCGPFVDAKHSMIDGGSCEDPFDIVFAKIMKSIIEALQQLPHTHAIVVPSGSRDVHHTFIYPTPPFEETKNCERIHMMTDPCMVSVGGVWFGITSTDILFQLGKEEISFPHRSGNRLGRLATHLIQQRSFYPLYPPSDEINIDHEQLERVASLDIQPHVLIVPSDLLHFFKEVNGCIVMNPQRLIKGEGGGVFSRVIIKEAPTNEKKDTSLDDNDFAKRFCAEIVRI